jgi:acetylornithine deacetylase/succinyl-diaminopimelate desuccinylase-like protein
VFSQVGLRPTIQVTGISGGHTDTGFQNIIPHTATAHINIRFVQQQTVKKVLQSFDQWLRDVVPPYVTYEYILGDVADPVKVDLTSPIIKKAQTILESITQKPVIYKYAGASLPIVDLLDKEFHKPMILLPLVNEDCNAHGVNENFDIALLERGMLFSSAFFAL